MIEKEIELERKVLRGDIAREVITFEEAVPADSKYQPERFTTTYKMALNRFSLDIILSLFTSEISFFENDCTNKNDLSICKQW